jgi:hypothetical protein
MSGNTVGRRAGAVLDAQEKLHIAFWGSGKVWYVRER